MSYDLVALAEKYFKAYRKAEHDLYGWRRNQGDDIVVETSFVELPRSERDCIKQGIRAVVLAIDSDATFINGQTNAELHK